MKRAERVLSKTVTPHPIPLPMGEGTLEPGEERAPPSPLPWGEGQDEGSSGRLLGGAVREAI